MKFRNYCALMSLAIMSVLSSSAASNAMEIKNKSTVNKSNHIQRLNGSTLIERYIGPEKFMVPKMSTDVQYSKEGIMDFETSQLDVFCKAIGNLADQSLSINSLDRASFLRVIDQLLVNFGNFLFSVYYNHYMYNVSTNNPNIEYARFAKLWTNENYNDKTISELLANYNEILKSDNYLSKNFKLALKRLLTARRLLKTGHNRMMRKFIDVQISYDCYYNNKI